MNVRAALHTASCFGLLVYIVVHIDPARNSFSFLISQLYTVVEAAVDTQTHI